MTKTQAIAGLVFNIFNTGTAIADMLEKIAHEKYMYPAYMYILPAAIGSIGLIWDIITEVKFSFDKPKGRKIVCIHIPSFHFLPNSLHQFTETMLL